jgi:hypothetical protein
VITDPAKRADDVMIEMNRDELKGLYERIGCRPHAAVQPGRDPVRRSRTEYE